MTKIWDEGFREMTSATKPLIRPQDLAGFKMRVPPSHKPPPPVPADRGLPHVSAPAALPSGMRDVDRR